jgi:predicted regulator of Ras-like GTPase activity (Roadblock/LC7/MglB family)
MFTLFKKMFGKERAAVSTPATATQKAAAMARVPRLVSATPAGGAQAASPPQVAVAHLSLAAILQKFPEDLRGNVMSIPEPSVTVALPLATIHKQLGQGAVKMSLASLYRQAPAGVFRESKTEEKRMVEVPLAEVMRHVDVSGLRRRPDQRQMDLPAGAPSLFGDRRNPYAIAPSFTDEEEGVEEEAPVAPRVAAAPSPQPAVEEEQPLFKMTPRTAAAPIAQSRAAAPLLAAPPAVGGTLTLRLQDLCGAWPEPIRSEAAAYGDAQVALPAENLAAALTKGKVTFTWGQIRSFLTPAPHNGSAAPEATELQLPLKVVAPAFMALSKKPAQRKKVEFDESIPTMFEGGKSAPAPEPASAPEPAVVPAPEHDAKPDIQRATPQALKFVLSDEKVAIAPEPEAVVHAPAPVVVGHAPAASPNPLGDLFGKPEKARWSVQEIIDQTVTLPDVAGAVVCLQEGLLVAENLPGEMKGETMAAFIPQMFARLNMYTGEMKLSAVDDILMTTNGAHFQAYRMGQVYFAVLGQQGGALPWESLRIVMDELARQSPA